MEIWVNGKFNFNILSFTYFQLQESLSDTESYDPGQTLLQYLRLNLELKGNPTVMEDVQGTALFCCPNGTQKLKLMSIEQCRLVVFHWVLSTRQT